MALYRDYWMIQIFPGKTAVYVSCPYSGEHSCKKAKKSKMRFSGNFVHTRTDGPTNRGLTSTEVENWNVLTDMLNFSLVTSESTVWLLGLLRLLGRLGLLRLLDSKRPYSWFLMFDFLNLWHAVTFWPLLNFVFFVFLTSNGQKRHFRLFFCIFMLFLHKLWHCDIAHMTKKIKLSFWMQS